MTVLVAGGGLAGAAAAAGLAQAGIAVTVVERQPSPVDKICGEFLSHEAQTYLLQLGLDVGRLGGAEISRLRLVRGSRSVEAKLPFRGIGISRCKLDEALLRHAAESGAKVLRGRTIRQLQNSADLAIDVEGEGVMTAETLLLATGKHELRGARRNIGSQEDLVGFKMYFRLNAKAQAALAQYIELIFFAGGYAGLQLIEDGIANLCLLVKRGRLLNCGGSWETLLEDLQIQSPYLAGQLRDSVQLLPQPLTIYRVPYGFMHRHNPADPANLFRLGDQACVIHSFTGDGMALALHSAALCVQTLRNGGQAAAYHRRLARDVSAQIKRANMLSTVLNHPATQPAMFELSKLWPASLGIAAALTRVPAQARI